MFLIFQAKSFFFSTAALKFRPPAETPRHCRFFCFICKHIFVHDVVFIIVNLNCKFLISADPIGDETFFKFVSFSIFKFEEKIFECYDKKRAKSV
jgi:hypothetical protein